MALTTEQLLTIKTKIETDKILPLKAIRELFPDENKNEVRTQLFAEYDVTELRSHSAPAPLTNEQKLEKVNEQLANIEVRKARLLTTKAELEAL